MDLEIQKASIWKRFSAFLFDAIFFGVVSVGFALLLSMALGFDDHSETLNAAYAKYEAQYGIVFDISQEEFLAMTPTQREQYDAAYGALVADQDAMYAYNMMINETLLITSVSILLGCFLLDFVAPLFLGNGQTLGKKIFGICLMRVDNIRVTAPLLFIRTILGKYTLETMIPALLVIMIFFNVVGFTGTLVIGLIALLQVALLCMTKNHTVIHDLLAKTIVVDYSSQRIFQDEEELIAYKKRIAAEKAARGVY